MPRRRTRIAALENAARGLVGLAPLRPPMQQVTGVGGIPSAEAFGGTQVVATFSVPWESLARVAKTVSLPWESEASSRRRRIRVPVAPRRAVFLTRREVTSTVGAFVGGFANPADGRAAALGLVIGYGVGWLLDAYGPSRD